ncbi:MAG: hypothetical protein PHQ23_07235, partial [Candidatus Wallbacteria bacterium]|nr:hypothetical protein [Candidatus Wallbacteria bacterium]
MSKVCRISAGFFCLTVFAVVATLIYLPVKCFAQTNDNGSNDGVDSTQETAVEKNAIPSQGSNENIIKRDKIDRKPDEDYMNRTSVSKMISDAVSKVVKMIANVTNEVSTLRSKQVADNTNLDTIKSKLESNEKSDSQLRKTVTEITDKQHRLDDYSKNRTQDFEEIKRDIIVIQSRLDDLESKGFPISITLIIVILIGLVLSLAIYVYTKLEVLERYSKQESKTSPGSRAPRKKSTKVQIDEVEQSDQDIIYLSELEPIMKKHHLDHNSDDALLFNELLTQVSKEATQYAIGRLKKSLDNPDIFTKVFDSFVKENDVGIKPGSFRYSKIKNKESYCIEADFLIDYSRRVYGYTFRNSEDCHAMFIELLEHVYKNALSKVIAGLN